VYAFFDAAAEEVCELALVTVEGIYRDGRIELQELPLDAPAGARVLVTFLPPPMPQAGIDESANYRQPRREAVGRLLARLKQGIDFGGPPYPKREELYDRVSRFDPGND
jgi:hypothetical protein